MNTRIYMRLHTVWYVYCSSKSEQVGEQFTVHLTSRDWKVMRQRCKAAWDAVRDFSRVSQAVMPKVQLTSYQLNVFSIDQLLSQFYNDHYNVIITSAEGALMGYGENISSPGEKKATHILIIELFTLIVILIMSPHVILIQFYENEFAVGRNCHGLLRLDVQNSGEQQQEISVYC